MRAQIYELTVYEGVLAWTHNRGATVRKLVIPYEGQELTVLPDSRHKSQEVFANLHEKHPGQERTLIGEVEVPDEIVTLALQLVQAKTALNEKRAEIEVLLHQTA